MLHIDLSLSANLVAPNRSLLRIHEYSWKCTQISPYLYDNWSMSTFEQMWMSACPTALFTKFIRQRMNTLYEVISLAVVRLCVENTLITLPNEAGIAYKCRSGKTR